MIYPNKIQAIFYFFFNKKYLFFFFCLGFLQYLTKMKTEKTPKNIFCLFVLNEYRFSLYICFYLESNLPICQVRTHAAEDQVALVTRVQLYRLQKRLNNFAFLKCHHHCVIVLKYLTHKIDIYYQPPHMYFMVFSYYGL